MTFTVSLLGMVTLLVWSVSPSRILYLKIVASIYIAALLCTVNGYTTTAANLIWVGFIAALILLPNWKRIFSGSVG